MMQRMGKLHLPSERELTPLLFLSEAALWSPDYIDALSAWTEHVPFAFWLTEALGPTCFVELGTHSGVSYLAFCQAIEALGLPTRAYAIDAWMGDEHTGYYGEDVFAKLSGIHDTRYACFSRLVRARFDEAIDQFADSSIDLLHINGLHTYEAVKHDFETWRPKLGPRSVVLLHDTNVRERGFGVWKLWRELAETYPHFEFLHGHGLGVLGVGAGFPSALTALFAATYEARTARCVRGLFSRLGGYLGSKVVVDKITNEVVARDARIAKLSAEVVERDARIDELSSEIGAHIARSADLSAAVAVEEARIAELSSEIVGRDAQITELAAQTTASAARVARISTEVSDRDQLIHEIRAQTNEQIDGLRQQLEAERATCGEVRTQAGAQAARIAAMKKSVSWQLTRPLRWRMPRKARKKLKRVWKTIMRRSAWLDKLVGMQRPALARKIEIGQSSAAYSSFLLLPWHYNAARHKPAPEGATFKLLLVSHEATRSGAPTMLLNLIQYLVNYRAVECWIVLDNGGELASEFAVSAPTLAIDRLVTGGYSRNAAYALIASSFRSYAEEGAAICNTVATARCMEVMAQHDVPILAWLHELPTLIDIYFGGRSTLDVIVRSARRIVCPSEFTRQALIGAYGVSPSQIVCVHNGISFSNSTGDGQDEQNRVSEELGLPKNARIVLGCGRIEPRKGPDLFIQVAKRCLSMECSDNTKKAYFVWVGGRREDEVLKAWLEHDIDHLGLAERIKFIGHQNDPAPYFIVADVFFLSSREEPFPTVNLEALAHGTPVVAFEGAGGAPEVLQQGIGEVVPYLDVQAAADAVLRILGDPAYRRTVSQKAQAYVSAHHSLQAFGERFMDVLRTDFGLREDATVASDWKRRIVFVSGWPTTPGHIYRVTRYVRALNSEGFVATWIGESDIAERQSDIATADALVVWRCPWTPLLERAIKTARGFGKRIVFDIDDLLFLPDLAKPEIIDGIRSMRQADDSFRQHCSDLKMSMLTADYCTATTETLAEAIRRLGKPAIVLPNGFDEFTYQASRRAVHKRRADRVASDGLIRLGYAAGTKTHQKDFARAAVGVAEALRRHPKCRLVLFEQYFNGVREVLLDLGEFPVFRGLEQQIEWRSLVPLEKLPEEIARFDINLVPLEDGNIFCEAKSELKYFEAALVDVPTIASPTQPYCDAIRHGETGFLAGNKEEWVAALEALITQPDLRLRIARAALADTLWVFGPERRALQAGRTYRSIFSEDGVLANMGDSGADNGCLPPVRDVPAYDVSYRSARRRYAATAIVAAFNGSSASAIETLESARQQTIEDLDLVVVLDGDQDQVTPEIRRWIERYHDRFNEAAVLIVTAGSTLAQRMNAGIDYTEAYFVAPVQAGEGRHPDYVRLGLAALEYSGKAFAYATDHGVGTGTNDVRRRAAVPSPFIREDGVDLVLLVRKAAWVAVGGYTSHAWENYDLWCKLIELGLEGIRVRGAANEALAVIGATGSLGDPDDSATVQRDRLFGKRFPWLAERDPRTSPRQAARGVSGQAVPDGIVPDEDRARPRPRNDQRLVELLRILRCPVTGQRLIKLSDDTLATDDGSRKWPLRLGRPVLFEGLGEPVVNDHTYLSNPLVPQAIDLVKKTNGLVLNLSAGGSGEWFPNMVEVEARIFRNTDVLADSHALPFRDGTFDLVLAMNAFEHYHSPEQAALEARRVLRPGGRILIHTAFLQPLHDPPWHFYNCTKFGLLKWFKDFKTLRVGVSENFNPSYGFAWLASRLEELLRHEVAPDTANVFMATPVGRFVEFWRDPKTRDDPAWCNFHKMSEESQEHVAAGFEFYGEKT